MTLPNTPAYLAFLVIHILSGFVGMYGGLVPLFTRKGGKAHRKWGLVFTWSMGIAAATAFPLAWWREDPLQVVIGVFSGYLTLFGYRVLRRHNTGGASRALDWGAGVLSGVVFLATVALGTYLLFARPSPEARVALAFGVLGLIVAGRDLHGLATKDDSISRRILDHMVATSLAVTAAFAAFLNTQFYRLTHLEWQLDARMLLPVAVALPLLACWLPAWIKRLRTEQSTADILKNSGAETSEQERMRGFGMAEGITFLLLIFIAVPLKHLGGHPEFVRVMGSLHGAMFVLYAISVIVAGRASRWPFPKYALALGAGVLPFGTFLLDAQWRREGSGGKIEPAALPGRAHRPH